MKYLYMALGIMIADLIKSFRIIRLDYGITIERLVGDWQIVVKIIIMALIIGSLLFLEREHKEK